MSKRFLLVTWDGGGNLPPELALAQELVHRGHAVDILAQDSVRERAESAGCRFIPLQSVCQWDPKDVNQPEDETRFLIENICFAGTYADDINAALDRGSYDALLVDWMLAYGISTGLSRRIPTAVLFHNLYHLIESGPFAELFDFQLNTMSNELARLELGPYERFRRFIEAANAVLVFSYADFDKTSAEITHVGPLRPTGDGEGWSRQRAGRPLVLVGLSTTFQDQRSLLQRICNALGKLPVEGLVTTGPSISPSSLDTPKNVDAVEFIAHERVLPDVDLLITHAGHGTVMAGVTHGVPLLCVPMGRDQSFVGDRVTELGLGAVLDQHSSEEELRRRIEELLADESMRSTCSEFARTLSTHPGLQEAMTILEGLPGSRNANGKR